MKNVELKKIFRNRYVIRVAAGVVTVAVIGTSAGISAYPVQAEKQEVVKEAQDETVEETEKTLERALSVEEENEDAGKEETVYVMPWTYMMIWVHTCSPSHTECWGGRIMWA